MRSLVAVVLATALLGSTAFAASDNAALAPGKPAGVQQANLAGGGFVLFFGLAVVAGGIALVASQGGSGNNIAVTTTSTGAP